MAAIFYSLCPAQAQDDTLLQIRQLEASIQSIRQFNNDIPIYLLSFGVPQTIFTINLRHCAVQIVPQPCYGDALSAYCSDRSAAIELYRVHHKWLALQQFRNCGENSLLYVDCDTVFLADPWELFQQYSVSQWYAREEPYSSHSHLGVDPSYIDEDKLKVLARQCGGQFIPPMNLGVILMNDRLWERVIEILPVFFSNVWNLLVGIAANRSKEATVDPRIRPVLDVVSKLMTPADIGSSIPHPSSNLWIIGEIAMMLALGQLQDFTFGFFSKNHVIQGGEFATLSSAQDEGCSALLCHYYAKNYAAFSKAFPQFWSQ